MNRKKKINRCLVVSGMLLGALLFTGCGEESGVGKIISTSDDSNVQGKADSAETFKYITDDFTVEDYLALAESYAELGMIRSQRNTLEQGYRLFDDETILDILSGIYVNLDEEDSEVIQQADLMYQNMELEEYRPETFHVAETDEWFETMMPKLSVGVRNYYKAVDGQVKMVISVGYDEYGIKYTNVWYYGDDDKVLYMSYHGETAQMLETKMADGAYSGEFLLWTLNGTTGDITRESGSFEEGVLDTDGYAISFHEGVGESDVYDLWNNRENMTYEELDGYGGAPGKSQLKNVAAVPEFTVYEPVADALAQDYKSKVRVFDGEIQLLSDNGWITLGTVEEYESEDPFIAYAEAKKISDAQAPVTAPQETVENTGETVAETTNSSETTAKPATTTTQNSTTTTTPAATTQNPTTTTKPAATTQNPTTTTKPAATTTTQPSTTPSEPDDNDDGDDGNNDSNDNNNNTNNDNNSGGNNDSGNAGGSDNNGGGNDNSAGNDDNGGDVDIEWTDDIL
jgi:hypothetical protein